ncbi:hypothetical protein HDU79_008644, partial [Rhizoclosmatium sp. JEL0117]
MRPFMDGSLDFTNLFTLDSTSAGLSSEAITKAFRALSTSTAATNHDSAIFVLKERLADIQGLALSSQKLDKDNPGFSTLQSLLSAVKTLMAVLCLAFNTKESLNPTNCNQPDVNASISDATPVLEAPTVLGNTTANVDARLKPAQSNRTKATAKAVSKKRVIKVTHDAGTGSDSAPAKKESFLWKTATLPYNPPSVLSKPLGNQYIQQLLEGTVKNNELLAVISYVEKSMITGQTSFTEAEHLASFKPSLLQFTTHLNRLGSLITVSTFLDTFLDKIVAL